MNILFDLIVYEDHWSLQMFFLCVCVCVCVCIYTHTHKRMYMCTCIHAHTPIYTHFLGCFFSLFLSLHTHTHIVLSPSLHRIDIYWNYFLINIETYTENYSHCLLEIYLSRLFKQLT